jgi:hypothetical protein
MHSPTGAGGRVFGPKTRNRAVARFWVCRVKQRCRAMTGGAGWGLISWRQRVGYAFANARPGGGVWAKNPKLSDRGSVSGPPGKTAA